MNPEAYNYRIAFFTNTYRPFVGGVAMSVDLYQRYLKSLGDRVVVYAPEYDDATTDGEELRRLPAIRHFNNTDFSLPLPLSFKPIMDFSDETFDIVHVHHPFLLGEMGLRLARQNRLPLVFTYHTQYEQYTHYVPVTKETAVRTILRHTVDFCNMCDLVIAPTHDMARMIAARGVQTRIEVLPTGIELARYGEADRLALRREIGIAEDAPLLIHVGRLAKEKNLIYLMKACLLVLQGEPKAHLAIAGDGKIRDELERMASDAGEPGRRIHFLGSRTGPDLINVYCAGDLFVFASKTETQGMVIAEAMGAATPAVALDACGIRDVVRDGVNGRLLPADADEETFAQATLDSLKDKTRLAAWREGARQTARELDMTLLARKLHELYMSLKLVPNHQLRQETMSFGLIRSYFETVWEDLEHWFTRT